MSATYLHPVQQLRVHQVVQTHKNLKELNLATEEAVRCHDRYYAALEKVMSCLLNNSDVMEEVRRTGAPDMTTVMAPTAALTSNLVSAYTNWRLSPELDALRGELEALRVLSTEGRHTAKNAKTLSQKVERCATQCAYVNSPAFQSKMAHRTGKAQEKLANEARDVNAKMVEQDMALYQAMKSNSVWWSTKLTGRVQELYGAFARLGGRTAAVFPPTLYSAPPPMALGVPAAAGAAAPAALPYIQSRGDAASYTSGVPLDFYASSSSTKSAA